MMVYHKPKRCHTGEHYGAITVGRLLDVKESRGTIKYEITYTCCGKETHMTQKELNVYRGNMPGQCLACRKAGKKPINLDGFKSAGHRATMTAAEVIETPWGRLQTIHGWGTEAHISRPWAFE
jgi:hypothetical protein